MEDNLFLSAMDTDKRNAINAIKANKKFALRIIADLSKVFSTNHQVEDEYESVTIKMKKSPSNNWYGCFRIVANKDGVKFHADNLGYYSVHSGSTIKPLGKVYEKYKETSRADDRFATNIDGGFGNVYVTFSVSENDVNLSEKLNDMVYLMEHNQFTKVF